MDKKTRHKAPEKKQERRPVCSFHNTTSISRGCRETETKLGSLVKRERNYPNCAIFFLSYFKHVLTGFEEENHFGDASKQIEHQGNKIKTFMHKLRGACPLWISSITPLHLQPVRRPGD